MQSGILYGIGVGPGDPELITVKGLGILQRVPVVAFPAGLHGKPGIAQQMVAQWLNPRQVQLALTFPYVQESEILTQAWQVAAQEVWQSLKLGQDVAFVSEGDVSFYSTFTYLAQTLQQLHPEVIVQTVPGICSPLAAAAVLGIPLTIRAQRLVVLPAIYTVGELEAVLEWADVVVLMKVSSVYEQVWKVLQQRGLLERSWVVERATLPEQVIYAGLSDRPNLKLPYFSLLIVQVNESVD
ncbi:precorrin-2 C(20)-methyltransferase [Coleofasciculus sp. FACHB-64]|uniref:precorrin-2 C(20)-methyltransferase n=1 Tax=Cyanophyceae TaxID=3028117 RepID=UPI00168562AE|nr:precorrin-2 C(20)-methyltransferase [Coleofasciculus sp. FACHB-T130]MBD1888580.1 precorrin-2 C(20)-methyltransferase [Coleofasciculus sp. FACHB-SPT9]MBD1894395.1 precorrin-2 C(20)-methyltransferase [Coleofasciculus sp. FACHB-129]MBD1903017.1 precorrin-2 C(20)-methyltransferase [Coleofasciculus sp. FACHB-125]MBD1941967.1 precorrin-2 C(20)-methyltransferase [Coleofasciculus sp. FACHB-712]MBD2049133.1 precorrin-2 C(20)-methyltransferase [Coleofasciculus sp. FACHB-64]MBD2541630.1 precorrin-2 C